MPRRNRRRPKMRGTVYQRGPGNFWISWWENSRRRYDTGYASRQDALDALEEIVRDVKRGRVGLDIDKPDVPMLAVLATEWLERRKHTHRSHGDDNGRWNNHLKPWVGNRLPDEVDPAMLRKIIEAKLAEGLSSSTVRLLVRLLSTFYSDLVERGLAVQNPVKALPRATRRLIKPAHDPRTTPFVEKIEDVRRIYLALPEPLNLAYSIGALAGLRTGEILALKWAHVDLENRRIHVRESIGGPLKDDESRVVPIVDGLLPVLKQWRLRSDLSGTVVPSLHRDGKYLDPHTVGPKMTEALARLKLPKLSWYQATRHTFASHWVMAGGTIEKLKEILGHSSVLVTERYAHLRGDVFGAADMARVAVDLRAGNGQLLPLSAEPARKSRNGAISYAGATGTKETTKATA